MCDKHTYQFTASEFDAILAGLRLLAASMRDGRVTPNDGDVGDILTNSGEHPGLSMEDVFVFGDRLCGGD